MSLGNREGKVCEETEPEELPELVQLKCTASDRRLQGDRHEAGTKPNLKQKNQWNFTVR